MSKRQPSNGRTTFTLMDMIRALRGFRSPEGYVVIPNEIAEKIEDEIERLYDLEETAGALAHEVANRELRPHRQHPLIVAILGETPDEAVTQ